MPSWVTGERLLSRLLIRQAHIGDLPRIVELLQELSLGDGVQREDPADLRPYEQALRDIDANPYQQVLVADYDHQVVGCVSLTVVPNLSYRGRPYLLIESMVVDPALRGKGIGRALVQRCIEEARAAGCFRLQLTSNRARRDAHRFYRRLGFVHSHHGYKLYLNDRDRPLDVAPS